MSIRLQEPPDSNSSVPKRHFMHALKVQNPEGANPPPTIFRVFCSGLMKKGQNSSIFYKFWPGLMRKTQKCWLRQHFT